MWGMHKAGEPCQKWGAAPPGFDERRHFLVCPSCGQLMYSIRSNPAELAFPLRDKLDLTFISMDRS